MNVFTFTGNLGNDAEVRQTASGASVCSFSVAVSSGYGANKKTSWVKCSMFGKRAEGPVPQMLRKGSKVAVSGAFEMQSWTNQNGEEKQTAAVMVNELTLLDKKPDDMQQPAQGGYQQQQPAQQQYQQQPAQNQGYQQQAAPQQAQPVQNQQQQPAQGGGGFDDDIPFGYGLK